MFNNWYKKEKPFLSFAGFGGGVGGRGASSFKASGGTVTTEGDYTVHTFTHPSSGQNFVVESGTGEVIVECLGGGGGGSSGNSQWAVGGGGGGYAYASLEVSPGTYPVVVGQGAARQGSCGGSGNDGGNSQVFTFTGYAGQGDYFGNPGVGGNFAIPGGTDLGSNQGQNGDNSQGDGNGWGGHNGKRMASPPFTAWGGGASGVPNFTPGNNASGYGNGGSGGHSCQNGHSGGGSGSPGIIVVKYLT